MFPITFATSPQKGGRAPWGVRTTIYLEVVEILAQLIPGTPLHASTLLSVYMAAGGEFGGSGTPYISNRGNVIAIPVCWPRRFWVAAIVVQMKEMASYGPTIPPACRCHTGACYSLMSIITDPWGICWDKGILAFSLSKSLRIKLIRKIKCNVYIKKFIAQDFFLSFFFVYFMLLYLVLFYLSILFYFNCFYFNLQYWILFYYIVFFNLILFYLSFIFFCLIYFILPYIFYCILFY